MWGTEDFTAIPTAIRNSGKFISRYQDVALEDRGHWIMVEAKDQVAERISHWLKSIGEYSKGKL